MRVPAALLFFCATSALAQRSDQLYVNPSLLVSSSRFTALAGASVAIGENAEGLATNYAAVANRSPRLKRRWDWDLTFSLLTTPFNGARDFDNDGRPSSTAQPLEGQAGGYWQYAKFGLGAFGRGSGRKLCLDLTCSQTLDTFTIQGGIVGGAAFWLDQIVVGVGFNVSSATFGYQGQQLQYTGASAGAGLLIRLHRQPWRIGASFLSAHVGHLADGSPTELAGRPLFAGVVTPHKFTVGFSIRLGPGNERYNRVSQALVDEQPKYAGAPELPFDEFHDVPPGPLLLTVQFDGILPVKNATTVRAYLFSEPPVVAGDGFYLVPRLGAEWEVLQKRLRLRAGTWLEPNLVAGTQVRPHGTFGFEVFTVHVFDDWSISAALDGAPRYFAASIGIGFWR